MEAKDHIAKRIEMIEKAVKEKDSETIIRFIKSIIQQKRDTDS